MDIYGNLSGLLRCSGRGEKVGKDAVGGAEVGADVGTGAFAGIFQENWRQQQGIERLREAAGIGDREAATALDEVAGFLEFLMVGTENHRYAIYCSFVEIMDAGSESAADVGDVGEAVERRQFAERIDDDAAYVFHPHGHGSAGGARLFDYVDPFRQKHYFAAEPVAQRLQASLVEFMWSDDESHFGMEVEPGHIDVFISLPRRADYEPHAGVGGETGEAGDVDCGTHYVGNAVETGVARHGHVFYSDDFQQAARAFVLHVKVCEAVKHAAKHLAAASEKALSGAENRGNDICGDATAVQFLEIIAPEFIFYEDGHGGAGQLDEFAYAVGRIEGEIDHAVGQW